MLRPLISMPKGATPTNVKFAGEPVMRIHHSEWYWFIFRKTVWELMDNAQGEFDADGYHFTITVHKGYQTDLASTPQILWWLFPPADQRWSRAAVIFHDPCYSCEIFPRWFNDLLIREGMRVCGAMGLLRCLFYKGVRHWGWLTYKRHTEDGIKYDRQFVEIGMEKI